MPDCYKYKDERGIEMNLPNKLTVFRIILVPIMVIIPYLNIPGEWLGIPTTYWLIDLIFIIASITDKLDGTIARKTNQVTTFGKFLDPIADKILVLAALIMLVGFGKLPAWIPIIILFREFVVSGYRLIASQNGGKVIAASVWGKLKTVTQMIAIILAYVDKFNFGDFIFRVSSIAEEQVNSVSIFMTTPQYIINLLVTVMMLISVVATIFSGIDYLKGGKDLFKVKK
jgi:CDP-diacylglycerol--glycerol-3-phosphate 3-phosphatidyltransferase